MHEVLHTLGIEVVPSADPTSWSTSTFGTEEQVQSTRPGSSDVLHPESKPRVQVNTSPECGGVQSQGSPTPTYVGNR